MLQEDSNEGYGLKGLWVVTKKYLEREACKLGPDMQMHGSPPVGLEEVDTDAQAREGTREYQLSSGRKRNVDFLLECKVLLD